MSDVEAVLVRRVHSQAVVELHVVRSLGADADADFGARLTRAFAPLLLIGETVRVVAATVLKPDISIKLPVTRLELAAAASAVRDRLVNTVTPGFGIALDVAAIEQAARGVREGKDARVVAMALAGDSDLAAIQPQSDEVVRIDPDRLTFIAGRQP